MNNKKSTDICWANLYKLFFLHLLTECKNSFVFQLYKKNQHETSHIKKKINLQTNAFFKSLMLAILYSHDLIQNGGIAELSTCTN